jgi:L-asparaginase
MFSVINTGGTFNKRYNPIRGELEVPQDDQAVEMLCELAKLKVPIQGSVYKDSLEMDDDDRQQVLEQINSDVIIVHGTDTMDRTATFLDQQNLEYVIVLTGAMVPYSIDVSEAIANFMLAYGFLQAKPENGVYIAMHGYVLPYKKIKKDKIAGIFKPIE